jgi:hypothetical protein
MDYRLYNVGQLKRAELIDLFKGIPFGVSSLDLSWNELHLLSSDVLADALKILPDSIIYLNMGRNNLNLLSIDSLIQVFNSIPQNVTTLNLRGNEFKEEFHNWSSKELRYLFKSLPLTLISLDLSVNGLNRLSLGALVTFLNTLPDHIKTITIDDVNEINLEQFHHAQNKKQKEEIINVIKAQYSIN